MEPMTILAQPAETTFELTAETELIPVDLIWEQIVALSWLEAVLAISFGVVYMLYGWRIFKVLVVICFGLAGLFFKQKTAYEIMPSLVGSEMCIRDRLGALAGGILTAGLWYAFELPGKYILAGAGIGLIAGAMISFIVFKIAVMLFTSFGGGVLTVAGLVALLYQYECMQEPPTEQVKDLFLNQNWFLPVLLLVPTLIGIAIQNRLVKNSHEWKV